MPETVTPPSSSPETPVTETPSQAPESVNSPKEPNEVFLGGMIVGVLCLLLLVLTGTFGYFGYRLWQSSQTERLTPSIQELGEKTNQSETTTPPPAVEPAPTPTPAPAETATVDKALVEVKVLNGGGVRGSAGTLTEALKKAGYTKAAFGNTVADYTGTTIYHTAEAVKTAELIKEEVIKSYPKVTLAPAKTGDKDQTAATIVVILGK